MPWTTSRKHATSSRSATGFLPKTAFYGSHAGIGIVQRKTRFAWAFTGPMLRLPGVPYDVRRAYPYFAYDQIDFEIPVGENGDNYDRYLVRMEEMEQSIRIVVEQALEKLPWADPSTSWMTGTGHDEPSDHGG